MVKGAASRGYARGVGSYRAARPSYHPFIAALPNEEQAEVAEQVRQIVEGMGQRFHYPYRSELQAWVRRP